ncbi:MAG: hypothetical protein FWC61_04200 [Proteobacteria bacterium]|nr:hypothetical protein [Pseudomonadota bacterium]
MKKFLLLIPCSLLFALGACTTSVSSENGADQLVQLNAEPIGCQFLYKLESETSVYNSDDAVRYLENRIADQARRGNAYWITSQRTRPNEWVIFGPERAYIIAANVYRCPDSGRIATKGGGGMPVGGDTGSAYMYGTTY